MIFVTEADCKGLKYLPHVTDSGLGEAIRARGWSTSIASDPDRIGNTGDRVEVKEYHHLSIPLALVLPKLGLRGLDARIVAAARASGMER